VHRRIFKITVHKKVIQGIHCTVLPCLDDDDMPFQLNVRKRAYEASSTSTNTSSRQLSQPPIPSFDPICLPPTAAAVSRACDLVDGVFVDYQKHSNDENDDILCESRNEKIQKPIILLQLSDESSSSSVVSRQWSDDDSDDTLLPTAFPKHLMGQNNNLDSANESSSTMQQEKNNNVDKTRHEEDRKITLNESANIARCRNEHDIDNIQKAGGVRDEGASSQLQFPSQTKHMDRTAAEMNLLPSSLSVTLDNCNCEAPSSRTPPALTISSVSLMRPTVPTTSISVPCGSCDPPMLPSTILDPRTMNLTATVVKRTHRKRMKPSSPDATATSIMDRTHAQLLNLSKAQVASTIRPSALPLSSNITTNTTTSQPYQKSKGTESLSSVPGCLLCHFCPCRHLPKQEKKRMNVSTIPDPASCMNFTNMTPLTALVKHAQVDENNIVNHHLSKQPLHGQIAETGTAMNNNHSTKDTWKHYQDMEMQYISRIRRLEQTIAWFDHLAYKAVQDLKRVRGKIIKLAQHSETEKAIENPDLGLSDDEAQNEEDEIEELCKKKDDDQQKGMKRKVKWNNQYLDCNDFDWEDPTNFPSKLPVDVTEEAKSKLFTFRKSKST